MSFQNKTSIPSKENLHQVCSQQELLAYLQKKSNNKENFIIGGAEIFSLFLPYIDTIYLSFIPQYFAGDVFFPEFEKGFSCIKEEKITASNDFYFQKWERKVKKKENILLNL